MAHGFGVTDYCLFGATLLLSAGIGMFFVFKNKNKKTNEMFTGGGDMQILPTSLSLMTSFLSGVTLLGIPVEVYKRGALYWFSRLIGTTAATLVAVFIVLPILFEFRPTSVYEYFEARFKSKLLRKCGAGLYLLFMIAYMGVVLYAPAVALSGVTGVPPWIFYVVVGIICDIYTSFGGLKAVVWTDTFQAGCMLTGLVTLFVKGLIHNGGIGPTYEIAKKYGRFDSFSNFDLNPFQYMTVWTSIFGGSAFWFTLITFNQISVQRYFSMRSMKRAQTVLWVSLPGYMVLMFLADLSGLVMFAYYLGCDPITSKQVKKSDQLVIHYALDTIGEYPGLPGVFLACLFSGTLSTVSSGINSMAAVAWEDFIVDWVLEMSEEKKLVWVTLIALFFGCTAIAMAALADPLGGILQTLLSVMGAIGGPICGLFFLGMVFPQANRHGAMVGLVSSVLITAWIAIGNIVTTPYKNYALELPVDQCAPKNFTPADFTDYLVLNGTSKPYTGCFNDMYTLSEVFFPSLGIILVVLIGLPVSLIWKDDRIEQQDSVMHKQKPNGVVPRLCITEFIRHKGDPPSRPMTEKARPESSQNGEGETTTEDGQGKRNASEQLPKKGNVTELNGIGLKSNYSLSCSGDDSATMQASD